MAPPLRATLVTLGVSDVERAAQFYAAMGLKRGVKSAKGVAFFKAGGVVLSLYGRDDLAQDATVENSTPGFSGASLAYNVEREGSVESVLEAAAAAGGKIIKPAQRAFWGGYSGYFADPDGHLWEVAHNPGFSLDEKGLILLPP